MAFFNKIGEFAKNAADKTGDMLEINRLNSKISTENAKIAVIKGKIGDYCWQKFERGEAQDDEIAQLCGAIKACNSTIAETNEQIKAIKQEDSKPTEAVPTVTEPPIVETVSEQPVTAAEVIAEAAKCPECGASVAEGKRFCGECGAKLI